MDVSLVRTNAPQQLPMNGAVVTTTAPATGNPVPKNAIYTTLHMICAAAATVVIEVTNDPLTATGVNNNWITLVTFTVAAAGSASDARAEAWGWIRARTTAATAATRIWMGA